MSWFTTKKIGEIARLPGGFLIRIVSFDRGRVRLELVNPPNATKAAAEAPKTPSSPPAPEDRP